MREDSRDLIHKAKEGDKESLEKLTEMHMGLVKSCMRRFVGRGTDTEDLFQLGCMGLLKAILRFDDEFGVEFSTYAVPVILGEIRRFLRDDGLIKVSRSVKETARAVRCAEEVGEKEAGRSLTMSELSEKTGFSVEEITFAMTATAPPESLYRTVHEGNGQDVLLLDCVKTDEGEENEILRRVAVEEALKSCTKEERELIHLRYFEGKTQSEIAKRFGVSQVQISRMEKRILLHMRKVME